MLGLVAGSIAPLGLHFFCCVLFQGFPLVTPGYFRGPLWGGCWRATCDVVVVCERYCAACAGSGLMGWRVVCRRLRCGFCGGEQGADGLKEDGEEGGVSMVEAECVFAPVEAELGSSDLPPEGSIGSNVVPEASQAIDGEGEF